MAKRALLEHYNFARAWIRDSNYSTELTWQDSLNPHALTEVQFLREYAWVVLNSGFRESVVRKCFDYISLCFCDWESSESIVANRQACIQTSMSVFKNRRKIEAIANTAATMADWGFDRFKLEFLCQPIDVIARLQFMGGVTTWHLAKNLGVDVAKPDRHLVRIAQRYGYSDVNLMCRELAELSGDRISVADLVLWRFEEQKNNGHVSSAA